MQLWISFTVWFVFQPHFYTTLHLSSNNIFFCLFNTMTQNSSLSSKHNFTVFFLLVFSSPFLQSDKLFRWHKNLSLSFNGTLWSSSWSFPQNFSLVDNHSSYFSFLFFLQIQEVFFHQRSSLLHFLLFPSICSKCSYWQFLSQHLRTFWYRDYGRNQKQ